MSGQINILMVDDEEEFVQTLAERLELRGFNVRTVNDGEAAIVELSEQLPDMVVLDVMMPGLGGLEVLQQIRIGYPKLPVVLLTGRGSTSDGIEGMRLGAFDYIMKPVDIEELIEKINEGTSGKGAAGTMAKNENAR